MLAFFRRIINSKLGIIITFVVLGVIALAFAAGDVTGLGHSAGGMTPTSVATVGKAKISEAQLTKDVKDALTDAQQRQPTLDMAQFLDLGGMEQTLGGSIDMLAFEQFARAQGMVVSRALVDKQIAEAPSLRGVDGKFSPDLYKRLLSERRTTDAQLHEDLIRSAYAQQLAAPTVGATEVAGRVALPYASLLLEKRSGQVGFVPIGAIGPGAAPTDAELTTFYQRAIARYTVPERRIVRYALVSSESLKAQAVPTEAEIAQAYSSQAPRFAATEKRDLVQVTLLDRALATSFADKIKAGTPIAAAASAAGLEPQTLTAVEKATYAAQSSADAANAVFAAAGGAVVGPVRTALGWAVIKIGKVQAIPAKSLAQARPELVADLTKAKLQDVIGKVHDALDDGISGGSTFDELVADQKLTAQTTAPLLVTGADPDNATVKPDPAVLPLVQAAFQSEEGDSPQLVQTAADGSFAIVSLGKIVPAAPRPLAQIRAGVDRDFRVARAQLAARKIASDIVAKAAKGMPLAQAFAQAGVRLPPLQTLGAVRKDIANAPPAAKPQLALMFSMALKSAKLLEAPNGAGWLVISLDTVVPGDARSQPQLLNAARSQLGQLVGREYVEQFAAAIRNQIGVKRNPEAIARARAALLGQTPAQP
ncbi:peptidylprolyl isomerase [soil metagenome]